MSTSTQIPMIHEKEKLVNQPKLAEGTPGPQELHQIQGNVKAARLHLQRKLRRSPVSFLPLPVERISGKRDEKDQSMKTVLFVADILKITKEFGRTSFPKCKNIEKRCSL